MKTIDSRDLQFTLDETRALAGRYSPEEQVPRWLHTECAGWAAGIAMTLERLRRNAPQAQPAAQEMRKAAFGYFAGEVFDRASLEERRTLVATALAPRVSATIANELSGGTRAQQLLNKLESQQLFTRINAGTPHTYEYTPLFREFLLTRVEDTLTPGDFMNTVNKAVCLMEDCSELEALVTLITQTRNWESLLHLISQHGMRLLAQGHASTVRKWIDEVPAEVFAKEPWLAYWSGAASISQNPSAARELLQPAWAKFEERNDRMGQVLVAAAMLESHQMEWSTYAPLLVWIDRLQANLREISVIHSREAELRIYANLLFAVAAARPATEQSRLAIARVRARLESDVDVNHRMFAARALLLAHCAMFDADSVQEVTRKLQSMLQEQGCAPAARLAALNALAYGHWFAGAYSDAQVAMTEALGSAARQCSPDAPDPLHFNTRHLLAFVQRDRSGMAECIEAMRQFVKSGQDLGMSMLSQALAEQACLRGDLRAAGGHWGAAVPQADSAHAFPLQWMSRFALAGCRAMLGDSAGADDLLCQAMALFDEEPPAAWLRDYEFLAAHTALRRGDRMACHRMLSAALDTARYTGVASLVFAVLPSAMAELCMEAARCGIAIESVRHLIEHYRLPPPAAADSDWPWRFKVYVLGNFRLLKDDAPLRLSRRTQKRTLELLQALIAFGGHEVSAGALTDALWPDSDGDAGYHALESGLYRLRQLLGAPGAVIMSGGKLTLDRSYFWVDVWAFERELQVTGAPPTDAAARLARIRQLYAGHFLAHESDKPWAIEKRQALRDKFLRAIREAARAHESQRRWEEAANVYQTGLELDRMAEDLYRGLMICHRELGDHTEVLQVYRRCRELLSRMLGIQPNPKTQAIYQSIRQTRVAEGA